MTLLNRSYLRRKLHQAFRSVGYDFVRFAPGPHPLVRRRLLFKTFAIDLVLDVGANEGQFGSQLREMGYGGEIISFEPLASAFEQLSRTAYIDGAWRALPIALGADNSQALLNVAGNSQSSSLLDMLPAHRQASSSSKFTGQQVADVRTLDSLMSQLCPQPRNICLKIDTQGFEMQVLEGAAQSLPQIATLQLEMSLVPLYRDAPLFADMLAHLTSQGFELVSLESAFTDGATGRQLQLDGMFHRYSNAK